MSAISISREPFDSSALTASIGDQSQTIQALISDGIPTTMRTRQAEERLRWFAEGASLTESRTIPNTGIDAYKVLKAMLDHAPTERGKRYIACCIICGAESRVELIALANDWVKFLLYPFKSAYRHRYPPLTSTLSSTQSPTATVSVKRPTGFVELLHKRQGQDRCVVIPGHCNVVGAHIVRIVATGDGKPSGFGIHASLPSTWDILQHYVDLSKAQIEDLGNMIDSPSNGMLIDIGMHVSFDKFEWYFEQTSIPDEYRIVWLVEPLFVYNAGGTEFVKFESHSNEPIDLPNPKFLMIHAAMAKVLHSSGAGEVLDFVMDRFNPQSSPVPVGKFSSDDFDIRLSVLSLAGTHQNHLLPTNIYDH